MFLENFGDGWKSKFEYKINLLLKHFPEVVIDNIIRYQGMLRINARALDKDIQYLVNCVAYKIERESATTCEACGANAKRVTDKTFLTEPKCLCWKCYAIEIDSMELRSNK